MQALRGNFFLKPLSSSFVETKESPGSLLCVTLLHKCSGSSLVLLHYRPSLDRLRLQVGASSKPHVTLSKRAIAAQYHVPNLPGLSPADAQNLTLYAGLIPVDSTANNNLFFSLVQAQRITGEEKLVSICPWRVRRRDSF